MEFAVIVPVEITVELPIELVDAVELAAVLGVVDVDTAWPTPTQYETPISTTHESPTAVFQA